VGVGAGAKQHGSHQIETRLKCPVVHDAGGEIAIRCWFDRKEQIVEPGNSWGRGDQWSRVRELLELARKPDVSEWSAERRERILERVLARAEKERERRRLRRAFAAGASTVLVLGVLLKLLSGTIAAPARSSPELAGKAPGQHLATE
jgi:hypothetical protein